MPKETKNLVVALDLGTSKVAALVAELRPDGSLEVLGMGGHESKGLKEEGRAQCPLRFCRWQLWPL